MPINLRYGQQAVSRGFLTQQRLQQVLTKQRQLAGKGKKVSVRMILEKAKLLSPGQLAQIDRDLNIRVVKKKTGRMDSIPLDRGQGARSAPISAPNFRGEPVPQFSGMAGPEIDATVFSPPPPDLKERIRRERERAQEAGSFLGDDSESPFGADPFADEAMSPEPAEMQPQRYGEEMQPQPFGDEIQPEFEAEAELQPQFEGFEDEQPAPELARADSSPALSSLSAEAEEFGSDEEMPMAASFEEELEPAPAPRAQPASRKPQPAFSAPDFGDEIRSPEELESEAVGATGARASREFEVEPEPGRDTWSDRDSDAGEQFAEPAFTEEEIEAPAGPRAEGARPGKPQGRRGADDFADIEMPTGRRTDDLPTAPAQGDEVHPLRRGVGTSSSGIQRRRTTARAVSVPDDFSADDAMDTRMQPAVDVPGEEPVASAPGKGGARLPTRAAKSDRKAKARQSEPQKGRPSGKRPEKKKSTSTRVILLFLMLLAVVIAILLIPVFRPGLVGPLDELRGHPRSKWIFDYVEKIYQKLPGGELRKPRKDVENVPGSKPVQNNQPPTPPGGNEEPQDNSEGGSRDSEG